MGFQQTWLSRFAVHTRWPSWTRLTRLSRSSIITRRSLVTRWASWSWQSLEANESTMTLRALHSMSSILTRGTLKTWRPWLANHAIRPNNTSWSWLPSFPSFSRWPNRSCFSRWTLRNIRVRNSLASIYATIASFWEHVQSLQQKYLVCVQKNHHNQTRSHCSKDR